MKILLEGGKTKDVVAINIIEVAGRKIFSHQLVLPNESSDKRFYRFSDVKTGVAITGAFTFELCALAFARVTLANPYAIIKLGTYPQINEL